VKAQCNGVLANMWRNQYQRGVTGESSARLMAWHQPSNGVVNGVTNIGVNNQWRARQPAIIFNYSMYA